MNDYHFWIAIQHNFMLHFVLHLAENVLHFMKNRIQQRKTMKPKTPVNIDIPDKYWGFL